MAKLSVRTILFGAVMLLYWLYPVYLIRSNDRILREGVAYRFRLRPVDPVDAFRGRYIALAIEQDQALAPDFAQDDIATRQGYVSIGVDSAGFAYPLFFTEAIPAGEDYLPVMAYGRLDQRVNIAYPESMQYYFLNEKLGPLADEYYREFTSSADTTRQGAYLDVRILSGKAVIEELYFDGRPVGAFLREKLALQPQ